MVRDKAAEPFKSAQLMKIIDTAAFDCGNKQAFLGANLGIGM